MTDAPVVQSKDTPQGETEGRDLSGAPYQYVVLHESCRDHPGVSAVHAAHAAGEACFEGPAPADTRVVVLVAKDSEELIGLSLDLRTAGILHALMEETDGIRAGQVTALATMPSRDRAKVRPYFKRFPVLR